MASTFSELWTELKAEAAAAVKAVEDEAIALEQQIVPIIEKDIVLALGQLKSLAISSVIEIAKDALMPGADKFGTVVTRVFQQAEAQGLQIAIQDAQLLAQQAYQAVATSLAPPAT